MKVEKDLQLTLNLTVSETNNIITSLNAKVGEIVNLINKVQQQATEQVSEANTPNPPAPPGNWESE